MSYLLFLDDERDPKDVTWVNSQHYQNSEWVIARDFWEFKQIIAKRGIPSLVSFDHDLGDNNYTGKSCAEFISSRAYLLKEKFDYLIHSMNPVGFENIKNYLEWFAAQREQGKF